MRRVDMVYNNEVLSYVESSNVNWHSILTRFLIYLSHLSFCLSSVAVMHPIISLVFFLLNLIPWVLASPTWQNHTLLSRGLVYDDDGCPDNFCGKGVKCPSKYTGKYTHPMGQHLKSLDPHETYPFNVHHGKFFKCWEEVWVVYMKTS